VLNFSNQEWRKPVEDTPAAEWSRKVAAALVPAVRFTPTRLQVAKVIGCWILKRPYQVPGYMIEVRAMIRPDVDVRFEIASVVAEIHR